jgi:hypothetical protein
MDLSESIVGDVSSRLLGAASGRPPYLRGEPDGTIRPSAARREEVRLAQENLDRWQDAFDQNCLGYDPNKYHAEIRVAERRLRLAISAAVPCLPMIKR